LIIYAFNLKGNEMAESKFTPGPWVAEQHRDCGIFRIKAGDQNIASLSFWNEANEDANAELMADAPRLLELLRTIHNLGIPLEHGEKAKKARAVFWATKDLLEKHGG
jgi:hypothetical protein